MARFTLNLNAAATQKTKNAPKVRVKLVDGVLMIKPTDRVCGKALPAGEKLLKLSHRTVGTVKFSVRGFDGFVAEAGQQFGFAEAKHGWLALDATVAGAAFIRVCNS